MQPVRPRRRIGRGAGDAREVSRDLGRRWPNFCPFPEPRRPLGEQGVRRPLTNGSPIRCRLPGSCASADRAARDLQRAFCWEERTGQAEYSYAEGRVISIEEWGSTGRPAGRGALLGSRRQGQLAEGAAARPPRRGPAKQVDEDRSRAALAKKGPECATLLARCRQIARLECPSPPPSPPGTRRGGRDAGSAAPTRSGQVARPSQSSFNPHPNFLVRRQGRRPFARLVCRALDRRERTFTRRHRRRAPVRLGPGEPAGRNWRRVRRFDGQTFGTAGAPSEASSRAGDAFKVPGT